MTDPTDIPDEQDEALLGELRTLFAHDDPVPPVVTEAARAALGWRRLDADLAELLADSAVDTEALALARGGSTDATVRSVSFSAGEVTIDIEIHGSDTERTVMGQLSPPARAVIELQTPDQENPAKKLESDQLGRFRLALPTTGAFRLRVEIEGNWIETSWIPV